MTKDMFDEFLSKYKNYRLSFFKYKEGICEININGYDLKSEFNLRNEDELKKFIRTINILYNKCDDERLINDNVADNEYYLRDNIVRKIRKYQHMYKSEIIDELVEDVDKILEMEGY